MNFKQWVIDNYINEDSPKGDFARDIEKSILPNDDLIIFKLLNDMIIDTDVFNIYKSLKKEYRKKCKMNYFMGGLNYGLKQNKKYE